MEAMMMWNHGFWMGPWMWLISLVVFIGFIVLAVWLIRWIGQGGGPPSSDTSKRDRALEILRERYARGEISKEEFEQMRRDLER